MQPTMMMTCLDGSIFGLHKNQSWRTDLQLAYGMIWLISCGGIMQRAYLLEANYRKKSLQIFLVENSLAQLSRQQIMSADRYLLI